MRSTDALADLRRFGKPAVTTDDAAARLAITGSAASRALARLADAGLVTRLKHGLWGIDATLDPLALPEHLTAPYPSYVSLQTALFRHGVIEQVPQVVYVASLGPTRRVRTSLGAYSIHHLAPALYGGYEEVGETGIKLATAEKALVDLLYLTPARSRLFTRLPEVELPPRFKVATARRWVRCIPSPARRTMVSTRLERLLSGARGRR